MKTISAIYLNCKTILKDDWISKPDGEEEEEEDWKMHERNIRILTQVYHHEHYNMIPPMHDEIDSFDGPGFTGYIPYELDKEELEFAEFDPELVDYGYDVTPAPNSSVSFEPEELYDKINTLYLKGLNTEFQQNDYVDIPEEDEIICRLLQVEDIVIEDLDLLL
jgi:hypothetical protein